jgi:hypothetical protein
MGDWKSPLNDADGNPLRVVNGLADVPASKIKHIAPQLIPKGRAYPRIGRNLVTIGKRTDDF